jgi:hypothetical protein
MARAAVGDIAEAHGTDAAAARREPGGAIEVRGRRSCMMVFGRDGAIWFTERHALARLAINVR